MIEESSVFVVIGHKKGISPAGGVGGEGLVGAPKEVFSPADGKGRMVVIGLLSAEMRGVLIAGFDDDHFGIICWIGCFEPIGMQVFIFFEFVA